VSQYSFDQPVLGDYIKGRFLRPTEINGEWVSRSPADKNDELGTFTYSYMSVDAAVAAAREAGAGWRKRPFQERAAFLKKYQDGLRKREAALVEVIAREVGKPLWEARGEFASMVNKIDITINESMRFVADFELPALQHGVRAACRHKPLGVMAVIGPFNFPGHLPNGHIVPALLTGNAVVFKPSEKSPMTAQLMAEAFHEAGFPEGVFNLVQGERETGRRLCVHEGVDGVLFTGSYEVGTRIKQDTLLQHWKLLALEMGGKNPAIIWKDADLEYATLETLIAGFASAGQRCSATSRVIVHRSLLERFLERIHERAKAFKIGHPLENPFMGPLIDESAVDRYMKFQGIASREGCELVMRGKALEMKNSGNYVAPSICWVQKASLENTRKSVYQQSELFAPNLAVLAVDELDEAIGQANATQYGLVASVFSKDRAVYEKCWDDLQMGLVNWNRSTIGASSSLPFGGLKKSGNHFPTAVTSTQYCAYPVSSMEIAEPKPDFAAYPGLNWE